MRAVVAVVVMTCAGVSSLGLTACGGDESEGGTGSFDLKVGEVLPLTGDLALFGPPLRKAGDLAAQQARTAADQAGADIGIDVEVGDEQSDPQAAVSAARQLVAEGATCIAGADASADTIPVGTSVAARERVPLISPASTSAEITDLDDNGYVFRTAPSNELQGEVLARTIDEELGGASGKTLSLAARNDAYGQGLIDKVKSTWEGLGGETRGPVLYDPEQASYNSEAAKIVAGDPDGIVVIDFPDTYAKVGAALARTAAFDAHKLFVAEALSAEKVPSGIPPEALIGARGTRPTTPDGSPATEAYSRLFAEAPGIKERVTFDAYNFDAVLLCFLAAVAADSNEGADIVEHIQAVSGPPGRKYDFRQLPEAIKALRAGKEIDYEGASGPIDLDEKGDPSSATYAIYSYQDDGTLRVDRTVEAD